MGAQPAGEPVMIVDILVWGVDCLGVEEDTIGTVVQNAIHSLEIVQPDVISREGWNPAGGMLRQFCTALMGNPRDDERSLSPESPAGAPCRGSTSPAACCPWDLQKDAPVTLPAAMPGTPLDHPAPHGHGTPAVQVPQATKASWSYGQRKAKDKSWVGMGQRDPPLRLGHGHKSGRGDNMQGLDSKAEETGEEESEKGEGHKLRGGGMHDEDRGATSRD